MTLTSTATARARPVERRRRPDRHAGNPLLGLSRARSSVPDPRAMVRGGPARRVLGWPKRCKSAHAFLLEYRYNAKLASFQFRYNAELAQKLVLKFPTSAQLQPSVVPSAVPTAACQLGFISELAQLLGQLGVFLT